MTVIPQNKVDFLLTNPEIVENIFGVIKNLCNIDYVRICGD